MFVHIINTVWALFVFLKAGDDDLPYVFALNNYIWTSRHLYNQRMFNSCPIQTYTIKRQAITRATKTGN